MLSAVKPRPAYLEAPLLNWVFEKLGRPGMATQAAMLRGPGAGLNTLLHSETPEQSQADNSELTRRTMGASPQDYAALPGWRRGTNEFAEQMITDPLSLLGGSGLLKHVATTAAEHALPAVARAGSAIRRVAPVAAHPALDIIGEAAKRAHSFATYGGPLKQSLAASKTLTPAQQALRFAQTAAAKGGGEVAKADLGGLYEQTFNKIVKGLSASDEHALYVAINNGTEYRLPKNLRALAKQFSDLTDTVSHVNGTASMQAQLASQGFRLPAEFGRFATAPLMKPANYRKAYLPLAHQNPEADLMDALQKRFGPSVRQTGSLAPTDRFLTERETGLVDANNETQRAAIVKRLQAAARANAAYGAQRRVASAFGQKAYKNVPGEARDFLENDAIHSGGVVPDAIKSAVDLQKQGMFYLPFRHMGNISFLQALHYPEAFPGTLSRFAQIMRDPQAAHGLLRDASSVGMAQAPSYDRGLGFADAIESASKKIGLPGVGRAVAGPYRWSNKVLWGYDDAAKSAALETVAQKFMKQGHSRADALALAAKEVGDRLVNYSQRSPLTKTAGLVAPFATWRTKLPGVIARAVAEHPERINAMGRLFPASVGGSVEPAGGPMTDSRGRQVGVQSFNPFTDTTQLLTDPHKYARATISTPYRFLASLLGLHEAKPGYPNYYTYGKKPLPYLAGWPAEAVPGGDELMNATGHGLWPGADFLMDLLGGQTGLRLGPVKK